MASEMISCRTATDITKLTTGDRPRLGSRAFVAGRGTPASADPAEQIRRLKRFLSPQVARFIMSCDERELLQCRRREVTVVFCDLRGFTSFSEVAAPDVIMTVLRMYHEALGRLTIEFDGTVERFTGDGIMVYFEAPPIETQAARAVRMAVRMRARVRELCAAWRRWGHDLDVGMGVALGFASVGTVGFEGRYDYAAIGPVTNLGSRLCAHAAPGEILISESVYAAVRHLVDACPVDGLVLRGFPSRVIAYAVRDVITGASGPDACLESPTATGYDTGHRE